MTGSELIFTPVGHRYQLPDGTVVPSVTEVLRAVGVSVDFEELGARSSSLSDRIEFRRALGTACHADIHALDDNDLDWNSVHPDVVPYVRAWETFRKNTSLVPMTRERRVYHQRLHYAGTLDGIFLKPDGGVVLVDVKTGNPESSGCAYQTAAYLAAHLSELPPDQTQPKLIERWGVELAPERTVPYRVHPYTNWDDWHKFTAFLCTYLHQAERRLRRVPA